ncbi:MAG TPA: hypothetical protein VN793_07290 [Acidimicrobiales bacterium]|nr:hypothetical protein [Acidimicrobiales bacterium]
MIETDLLSVGGAADPVLGSGWGGAGWGADDSGDDWGWSEGPVGDDGDERPYRRSRILRAVALVTAASVVIGSIGTWVAILAVGSPQPSYSVTSVRATVPAGEQDGSTTEPSATVSFVVANDSAQAGNATCRAVVSTAHGTVGSAAVRTQKMSGGETASLTMSVPLSSVALSGNGPAAARVSCLPTASTMPRSG